MGKHKAMTLVLVLGFLVAVFLTGMVAGEGWAAEKKDVLGGEFSLTLGANTGPFDTDTDFSIAGTLGIPLFRPDPLFGQNLLGQLRVGYSRNTANIKSVSPPSRRGRSCGGGDLHQS